MPSNSRIPWVECPTVEVDLDLPVKERFAPLPKPLLQASRCLLESIMSEIPPGYDRVGDLVRLRTLGRFDGEIRTLAQLVGAQWRKIAIANVSYDFTLMRLGCTTVVFPTPEGPVVARNMDWWPEDRLAWASSLVHYKRKGEVVFSNAGWTGFTGVVTGQSSRGFAVIMNAVWGDEAPAKTGYPVMLHVRRVLEDARDFDHALELLSKTRLLAPVLFTLVGTENHQRVVIERSPRRHALRWGEEGKPLTTTNDYRLLEPPKTSNCSEVFQTTCFRYDYITEHFEKNRCGGCVPADEQLLCLLSDEHVAQTITAQHVILHPRQNRVRLFVPRKLLCCSGDSEDDGHGCGI